jgi:hypothetical protein
MRNNVNSIWTEEVTATLRRLWSEGFSCSQIAAEIRLHRDDSFVPDDRRRPRSQKSYGPPRTSPDIS